MFQRDLSLLLISVVTVFTATISAIAVADVVPVTPVFIAAEPDEHLPGGSLSQKHRSDRASFSKPISTLTLTEKLDFEIGKAIFEKLWVFAPSSTTASDGLGPLYNARSCARCHIGNGRGNLADLDQKLAKQYSPIPLLLRLSRTSDGSAKHQQQLKYQGSVADPVYGGQLQTFAWPGGNAEGTISIHYELIEQPLNGEEPVILRKPIYSVTHLGYGAMHEDTRLGPRFAPPTIGLGLVEAIDMDDLKRISDPDDSNNDGISGRLNTVWDPIKQTTTYGRFGWKASAASLEQQNLAALNNDIGINSWLFTNGHSDCTPAQTACLQQPTGNTDSQDKLEASIKVTQMMNYYVDHLSVPIRYQAGQAEVLAGKELFYQSGCTDCHQPAFITGSAGNPKLAKQKIWPYSDFLLHDMGEALADDIGVFDASGAEWRTPPLWGIGLTQQVSGGQRYLHDGRAGNLIEAILWHGGEAETAKQAVVKLSPAQRKSLLTFLQSL